MSASLRPSPALALPYGCSVEESVARKSKIVCTIGPASYTAQKINGLLKTGANVFRLNFSHSSHEWHSRALSTIRTVAANLEMPIAVMQDLCGPKIRISRVEHNEYEVADGDIVRITTDRWLAASQHQNLRFDLASTYEYLLDDVQLGSRLLIDDGRVELEVAEKHSGVIVAQVIRGGKIKPNKGLNLPGVDLSTPAMTAKDWQDLEWGIAHEVDFVALSFVRQPEDLLPVRNRLDESGSQARLIAKIERPEAVEHIEEILAIADGLMVARGDLGLETELSRVPLLQKRIIECCRNANKPVITATQMLESMIEDSTPTRAEVSDVANAIYDGSDAIMLSAETATGKYPLAAVEVLHRVALVTEADSERHRETNLRRTATTSHVSAVTDAAAIAAIGLEARRVVVYSQSGATARLMARFRLPMPVVAVTNLQSTYRQLALSYGVQPVYMPEIVSLTQLLDQMDHLVLERNWGSVGDTLVVVSALDGRDGNTDTLHIHRVRSK